MMGRKTGKKERKELGECDGANSVGDGGPRVPWLVLSFVSPCRLPECDRGIQVGA